MDAKTCIQKLRLMTSVSMATVDENGVTELLPKEDHKQWLDLHFSDNPYMNNVYPGDSRSVPEVFRIQSGEIEYFNPGVQPIFRESYIIGNGNIEEKGYVITNAFIVCGKCEKVCPQSCITAGQPYEIVQENCLRCGLCYDVCPEKAVRNKQEG